LLGHQVGTRLLHEDEVSPGLSRWRLRTVFSLMIRFYRACSTVWRPAQWTAYRPDSSRIHSTAVTDTHRLYTGMWTALARVHAHTARPHCSQCKRCNSHGRFVCPSVRLSVTVRCYVQTNEDTIVRSWHQARQLF